METKTLPTQPQATTPQAILTEPLDDAAIVALFNDAGLAAEVVDNCGEPSCPVCFGAVHVRAA